jgi:hypothetical protein
MHVRLDGSKVSIDRPSLGQFGKEGEKFKSSPSITPKPITYHEKLKSIAKLIKPLLFRLFVFLTQSLFKVTLQSKFFFFLAKKISKVDFYYSPLCQKHTFINVYAFQTRPLQKVTGGSAKSHAKDANFFRFMRAKEKYFDKPHVNNRNTH